MFKSGYFCAPLIMKLDYFDIVCDINDHNTAYVVDK